MGGERGVGAWDTGGQGPGRCAPLRVGEAMQAGAGGWLGLEGGWRYRGGGRLRPGEGEGLADKDVGVLKAASENRSGSGRLPR